ncbi:hypothetical protein ACI6Q2_06720 [Chitinophagaceae bacterium LWZ2-11]
MQLTRFWIIALVIIISPFYLLAQSDYLYLGNKQYQLLDRLDIKLKNDSILGFTTVKPFNRLRFTEQIEYIDSLDKAGSLPAKLSSVDRYNIRHFLMDNTEWTKNYKDSFLVKPYLGAFYKNRSHFYQVDTKDFTMRIDPLLDLQVGHANDGTGSIYTNTRGIMVRGSVAGKIGYYTTLTDNQERDPLYVREWVAQHNAVPGAGFYKAFKNNGYDYFDMTGGITFRANKYFNFQFAYDKLFIGNGYRSLFLSDFSNNYTFLRMNLRVWKLNYEMILAQTIQSVPQVGREMKPQNYMAIHHLSVDVAPWLNLGVYENIMEEAKYGFQVSYLNPIIFYRATESNLGAAGKANIGFDFKSNINRNIQLYGQLLINEFHINEVTHYSRGAWVNKQALQLGAKYIDVLGVKNLDIQGEVNWIRPYTYMNFDSTTNFTHYNQPLAHPLGANVREFVALARYQPIPRLYLSGKLDYFLQGLDSAGVNMGSNILLSYNTRPRDYGFFIGTGTPVKSLTASLNASYEIFENMFIDLNATHRSYNIKGLPNSSVFFYSVGFRVNLGRREFNF